MDVNEKIVLSEKDFNIVKLFADREIKTLGSLMNDASTFNDKAYYEIKIDALNSFIKNLNNWKDEIEVYLG